MALLHTPTKDSSFYAAPFSLKDVSGKTLSFDDIKGKNGTLIMFICNHCPYVKAVIDRLVADCRELQEAGIGCVAIMPNDTVTHPDDSFENEPRQWLAELLPRALPEVNAEGRLEYRGRVDSAGPNPANDSTVRELRDAMLQVAKTGAAPAKQSASMGCSIKWK